MPAGGMVIEGAPNPVNLEANATSIKVFFVVFVLWALLSLSMVIPLVAQGRYELLIGPVSMLLASGLIGRGIWRRSRRAGAAGRVAPAGREIRWVVSSAGVTCIDCSKALAAPRILVHPASCVHRIVGERIEVNLRDGQGARVRRSAALLTAWIWRFDSAGRVLDLVPTSLYTPDGLGPAATSEDVRALVCDLEETAGVGARGGFRPLPNILLSTPVARFRFFRNVILSSMVLSVIVLMVSRSLFQAVGSPIVLMLMVFLPVTLVAYSGTLGVLWLARRRWARRNFGAAA